MSRSETKRRRKVVKGVVNITEMQIKEDYNCYWGETEKEKIKNNK